MKNFGSICAHRCAASVAPLGFVQTKKVFWRVAGDMYQTFYVETYGICAGVKKCRIGFCVIPLCAGINAETDIRPRGLYYLKQFEPTYVDRESTDGWNYTDDEKCQNSSICEIIRMLETYLIPFFERTTQSEIALDEVIALEALFNDNRLSLGPNRRPALDFAGPDARLNKRDITKYYLAVRAGNYDLALEVMENVQNSRAAAFRYYSEKFSGSATIAGIEDLVVRLKSGDTDYIANLKKRESPLLLREAEAYYIASKEQLQEAETVIAHLRANNKEYFRILFLANEERSKDSFINYF